MQTPEELSQTLNQLQPSMRQRFYGLLILNLTVCCRDPDSNKETLLGLAELIHTVSGQLVGVAAESTGQSYPLDVFCALLFEKAMATSCGSGLEFAIGQAMLGVRGTPD